MIERVVDPGKPISQALAGPAFDRETALACVEGDMELLQAMAESFARQSGKLLGEIAAAVSRQDGSALERSAHKLKGSVGNFGVPPAFQTALRLEQSGRAGEFAHLEGACTELAQQVASLQSALAAFIKEKVPCAS